MTAGPAPTDVGQHVLVPVDESPQSEKAFQYALEQLPEPRLTLLSVIDPMRTFASADGEYFDPNVYRKEQAN
jgi:nucleotide-binding universal stress UspA family protein